MPPKISKKKELAQASSFYLFAYIATRGSTVLNFEGTVGGKRVRCLNESRSRPLTPLRTGGKYSKGELAENFGENGRWVNDPWTDRRNLTVQWGRGEKPLPFLFSRGGNYENRSRQLSITNKGGMNTWDSTQ